jgi:aspartyl-tRNA(Asn)/glutamyl-tRNA(Gln) amidotransferase subunit A
MAGPMSAAAKLDGLLARVDRLDPGLNAFVHLDPAGARAAARDSDARMLAGNARSPIEGITLSIKDNILVRGLPATWGSRAFADFVPDVDELPVARLREAGAVIVGKTNVPELTLEGYTANELFGVTRNPWNADLTPGGSSGGAAASVAAGMVDAAIGTDGGGSIRRPASHTGLVGFKPSTGRIPRIDGFPAILTDFETIGTLTTSVADARALLRVMQGPDARDRRSLYQSAAPFGARRLRILHIPRFGVSPVDPEVTSVTGDIARLLSSLDHDVRTGKVFFDLEELGRAWFAITRAGVAWLFQRHERLGREAGAAARRMAAEGAAVTGADYFAALDWAGALRRRCAELFAEIDLILTPTAAALPWPAAQPYPTEIDGRPAGPRDHAVFTAWVNIAGLPAISLPLGRSRDGLPIGIQLVAGFGADDALLDFAEDVCRRRTPTPLPPL